MMKRGEQMQKLQGLEYRRSTDIPNFETNELKGDRR